MRSFRVEVVVFALALAVFGLVAFALIWSGDWAYALLASLNGVKGATFTDTLLTDKTVVTSVDLPRLLAWHRSWAAYVVGFGGPPDGLGTFSGAEYEHMADVRNVFRGAELVATLALGIIGFRVRRALAKGRALRLVGDGALAAAALVVAIGVAAVLAFDQLFLLFHELFFPQGNFLFRPDSNLIRLYPEWYWQGITAGVGLSFIAAALVTAATGHIALRRRTNTYTRAA
jgi:integral membrane protein (TIGR01906 family)